MWTVSENNDSINLRMNMYNITEYVYRTFYILPIFFNVVNYKRELKWIKRIRIVMFFFLWEAEKKSDMNYKLFC